MADESDNFARLSLLKKATLAIEELQTRLDRAESRDKEPIALVGIGCRFPGGADDPEKFWALLQEGRDAVGPIPADRWDVDAFFDREAGAPGKSYCRHGAFLERVDAFDPAFFGITAREAASMDPQQRLLLEVSWEALEHAGIAPASRAATRTGVFVGIGVTDYAQLMRGVATTRPADLYTATGNGLCFAAGRIAFALGLQGPTLAVDTACSSALVGVHLACQSLRARECDLALAGGVQLILAPEAYIILSQSKALSPDGRCKSFAAAADGFGRGEGAGIIALKRLSDAQRDGNEILALLRGSAVNHDGRSSGITVPNGSAQIAVLRQAYEAAGIAPGLVDYVEAHGTGTALGDPIELRALDTVMASDRPRENPLRVGSVKSNIGHLEAAAGIAGLIKLVLALRHEEIPPSLHAEPLNSLVDWNSLALSITHTATPWRREDAGSVGRIGGVSSFGFSGTNAHVVVGEAPVVERPRPAWETDRGTYVVAVSGRNDAALRSLAGRYASYLEEGKDTIDLGDFCHTANVGRSHFERRAAIVGESRAALIAGLRAVSSGPEASGGESGAESRIGFLFTGQGSQWAGMGRELYEREPVFRAAVDRCIGAVAGEVGSDLLAVMWGDRAGLDRTEWTQPALFALEWGLAELWRSWGIAPVGVLGHSVGEYVAASVAGVMSVEDGMRLVTARGRLMAELCAPGSMVAVRGDEGLIVALAQERGVSVAALNGPGRVVLSGAGAAIAAVAAELAAEGCETTALVVSHGFHSAMMEPMLADYGAAVGRVALHPPHLALISNVSGAVAGPDIAEADYWVSHVRATVRFGSGLRALRGLGIDALVELGPSPVLSGLGRDILGAEVDCIASLRRGRPGVRLMLEGLDTLYRRGARVDWAGLDRPFTRRKLHLPTYPFQRRRFWIETAPAAAKVTAGLPGRRVPAPLHNAILFETVYSMAALPFLADHVIQGKIVVPGACHLAHVLAALAGSEATSCTLEDVMFPRMLVLGADAVRHGQLVLERGDGGERSFRIVSFDAAAAEDTAGAYAIHATGRYQMPAVFRTTEGELDRARQRCRRSVDVAALYEELVRQQIRLGPAFRWIAAIAGGGGEAVAHLLPPLAMGDQVAPLHPGLIDGCFQALLATIGGAAPGTFVPFAIKSLTCDIGRATKEFWCHARLLAPASHGGARADLTLYDASGTIVADFVGLELRAVARDAIPAPSTALGEMVYDVSWIAQPPAALPPSSGSRCWLILADPGGLGASVAERLRRRGDECRLAYPEASNRDSGPDIAAISPDRAVTDVLVLWGLSDTMPTSLEPIVPESWLGPAAALHLVQSLTRRLPAPAARLWLVTRGAVMADSSPVIPTQAASFALARVIAREAPELPCVALDLDPRRPPDAEELAAALTLSPAEPQIALREGKHLVPRLQRRRMNPVATPERDMIRADGHYLITGGLGGLGLHVARWLVEKGARHLVLLGRRPPSPEAGAVIARLEERGARILVWQADIADPTALRALLDTIVSGAAPLAGIVHAAGFIDDGMLAGQSWPRFARVLAPKVAGSWNLHAQTSGLKLDFFVCFSSAAAIFGPAGQGNYAAANAFMDALMQWRREHGLPGLSIDWGMWSDIGMASRLDAASLRRVADQGIGLIDPRDGIAVLERLLAENAAQSLVMPIDAKVFRRRARGADLLLLEHIMPAQMESAPIVRNLGAEIAALAAGERRERLLVYLRQEIAAIMGEAGGAAIEPRQRFFDLGLDSLMAVELKNRLERGLGTKLKATLIFDYPTLEALTDHLACDVLGEEKNGSEATEAGHVVGSVRRAGLPEDLDVLSREELGQILDESLADIEQLIEGEV